MRARPAEIGGFQRITRLERTSNCALGCTFCLRDKYLDCCAMAEMSRRGYLDSLYRIHNASEILNGTVEDVSGAKDLGSQFVTLQ